MTESSSLQSELVVQTGVASLTVSVYHAHACKDIILFVSRINI